MSTTHWALAGIKGEHFIGPVSDTDNGFRTIPSLLRTVADWMDANDLQDPEFDNLAVRVVFVPDSDDDDFYYSASIYYRESADQP